MMPFRSQAAAVIACELARAAAVGLAAAVMANMRRRLDRKASPPLLYLLGPTGWGSLFCSRPLSRPEGLPASALRLATVAAHFQPAVIALFVDADLQGGAGILVGAVAFREQDVAPVVIAAVYQQTPIGLLFSPLIQVDPPSSLLLILGVALAGMDALQPSWPTSAWN